jgi:tetratricopeptide (TPR) repeat protein
MRAIIGFLIASVLTAASDREQEALGCNQTGMAHQQGRYGEAERAYWKAIRTAEEDPDDWQISVAAKQNLATVYLEHGVRFSKAEDLLRGALDVLSTRLGADAPNLSALLTNLGSARLGQNRLAEVARYFQRALPKVQGDQGTVAALQSNLPVLAYRQHKRTDAISHLLLTRLHSSRF